MTSEEIIEVFEEIIKKYERREVFLYPRDKFIETIQTAITMLKAQPCEDAVSREAALKALGELPHEYKTKEQRARTGGIAACQVIVGELPRVTPKPKTGKWIQHGIGFRCSECAIQTSEHNVKSGLMKYCPNCGAKMEGENE